MPNPSNAIDEGSGAAVKVSNVMSTDEPPPPPDVKNWTPVTKLLNAPVSATKEKSMLTKEPCGVKLEKLAL